MPYVNDDEYPNLFADQDDVLLGITKGRLAHDALRRLPPWRAVMLARVAHKAGVMDRADLDELVREARVYGELRPHRPKPTRR